MSREGPLDLVVRRAQVTSAMMTSRREGRVEAWVTWGWRGKARSRSEDQKKKKEAKTERANCFFSLWGFLFSGSRATGHAAGETWMEADVSGLPCRREERVEHIG